MRGISLLTLLVMPSVLYVCVEGGPMGRATRNPLRVVLLFIFVVGVDFRRFDHLTDRPCYAVRNTQALVGKQHGWQQQQQRRTVAKGIVAREGRPTVRGKHAQQQRRTVAKGIIAREGRSTVREKYAPAFKGTLY
jgi:apolipoprotein N-acyltransferase